MRRLGTALFCLVVVAWTGTVGAAESAADLAEKVMPAVVQVVTDIDYDLQPVAGHQSQFNPNEWIKEYGARQYGLRTRVMGSGAVIYSGPDPRTEDRHDVTFILTNYHVVAYAIGPVGYRTVERYPPEAYRVENYRWVRDPKARPDAEILIRGARLGIVVLPNQNGTIPARVAWYDEQLDVALVAVDYVGGVPTVRLGDSDAMRVGDTLYLAGAPLGIPFAFTRGTLSQKNLTVAEDWADMWRYDLAQNPGSSGSPIFNEQGEVVAVVRGSFVLSAFVPAAFEGGHLGIPINSIKFLWRWNGYGFLLAGDATDIIEQWKSRKFGR